ncbi:MAG: hypothetical protein AABY22_26900, partial [Nanoarchaeota archaeon]
YFSIAKNDHFFYYRKFGPIIIEKDQKFWGTFRKNGPIITHDDGKKIWDCSHLQLTEEVYWNK